MSNNRIVSRGQTNANPFANPVTRPGQLISEQFEEAIVVDVIVNNHHEEYARDGYNVGAVKFRFINSNYFRPDETLNWAFCMDANRSDYPLINEVVYVFQGLNRFYYIRKFNVSGRVTAQGMSGINEEAQPIPSSGDNIHSMRESVGNPLKSSKLNKPELGQYFTDKPDVWRLKHLEGDIIYEGRSGSSIRMGTAWLDGRVGVTARDKVKPWQSTQQDQSPNMLIRIGPDPKAQRTVDTPFGQVLEDINKDKSSIWMVSDQLIPLTYSTEDSPIHGVSVKDFPKKLDGNQIVINTDRFVVNTKTNKILINAAKGIHLTSKDDITLDSDKDHITWTTGNRKDRTVGDWNYTVGGNKFESTGGNVVKISGGYQEFNVGSRLSVLSPKVYIGSSNSESEPMVLGNTLQKFLDQLITILTMEPIIAITSMPGSPSPQNPARITALQKLKLQYLNNGSKAKILSLDNFTIRNNESPLQPKTITPYTEG